MRYLEVLGVDSVLIVNGAVILHDTDQLGTGTMEVAAGVQTDVTESLKRTESTFQKTRPTAISRALSIQKLSLCPPSESVADGPTYRSTNGRTDTPSQSRGEPLKMCFSLRNLVKEIYRKQKEIECCSRRTDRRRIILAYTRQKIALISKQRLNRHVNARSTLPYLEQ